MAASKRGNGTFADEEALRGTSLTSYLSSVESEVARLEQAIRVLPRVTPGGSSDCPFARDLYARKEELEASVAYSVTRINRFLRALQAEIARCERNLHRITGDRRRLRTPQASDAYGAAEDAQLLEYQSAVNDRDQIMLVLPRAEAALAVARTKRHPDVQGPRPGPRAPAGSVGLPAGGLATPGSSAGLSGEIADLVSMGRTARR